jgi:D-galactonate transporter
MKLLARSSFVSEGESRVYNKIAARLLPYLVLLYIISFLDRINVGFAKLQMASDIGLNDAAYGLGAGIFFLGYCLCEIPSNLLLQRLGTKFWIARILVVWGIVSTCTMFVRSEYSFYAMRFLLGVAEAGFYPGIVLYLTYWYPSRLRSQVWAIFSLGVALSGIIGGPLSGGIMSAMAGTRGLHGWQWLFLLEGMPAIVFGFLTYFYLDNGPADARWLSQEEKQKVLAQLDREQAHKIARGYGHRFVDAIKDPNTWLLTCTNFALLGSTYGVSFWLPQIIKDLGVNDLFDNGLITTIPWLFAAVGMIVVSRHSDRHNERRWHATLCAVASAAGLVMTGLFAARSILCLAGLSLAMIGAMAGLAVLWALPGTILSGTAAAAAIALMATVGNMGGYVSPFLIGWVTQTTRHLEYGLYVLAAITLAGAGTMLCVPKLRGPQGHTTRSLA